MIQSLHQYVERRTGTVHTEKLIADHLVKLLYHGARENAPILFRLLTSARMSDLLAFVNYDAPFIGKVSRQKEFMSQCGIDLAECLDPPESLDTPRKVFERRIRYWEHRPMPEETGAVVSPADARVLVGSFRDSSSIFVKGKFFSFEELLGEKTNWHNQFSGGDFAVFRLTPDKYHYNHTPVAGVVSDIFELDGAYHSCNPAAVVAMATPFSKNRRVVTIIDTDVPGGTRVGLVAMIEVVALMIGEIVQCYSTEEYTNPVPVSTGQFLRKGQPKSLYRPGSSTDILIFQPGRIEFADDLLQNMRRVDVKSRFSQGFNIPLVETDLQVRSLIARGGAV
ncbi:phosphatidylserine decarboxylase [Geobacter argillaceus]|uniref:Phosphatidylserine decarboxylase n=1 Tax=Geobacter argillaceus TaxID=345631 RepID=A0A562VGB8_9BACT|nr:phosphatidylserine decarboxylase [Geobacter argillaceus]TWJ16864.1 phosphatidylserine decarboxylase [Geobacter argillaceus]